MICECVVFISGIIGLLKAKTIIERVVFIETIALSSVLPLLNSQCMWWFVFFIIVISELNILLLFKC